MIGVGAGGMVTHAGSFSRSSLEAVSSIGLGGRGLDVHPVDGAVDGRGVHSMRMRAAWPGRTSVRFSSFAFVVGYGLALSDMP